MTKRDEKTAFHIEKQNGILLHCNNIPYVYDAIFFMKSQEIAIKICNNLS